MSYNTLQSGIQIIEVRVRNFRSLKEVDIKLDQLTILIGENNSGKTGFLEAMFAAIGSGRRVISPEDIYLAPSERKIPKDRSVTIDILIRPVDKQGNIIESFPANSFWLGLWQEAISQDEESNDFLAIRTQMKWDEERGEYITERKFLQDWQINPKNWKQAQTKQLFRDVIFRDLEYLLFYMLDAKRDIQDDMNDRNSFWYKLVSESGITDDKVKNIETKLSKINQSITEASEVLQHIQENLDDLYQSVASVQGSVSITPIAQNLRNLSKGIDINFATKGAKYFPLTKHGMGTRSLAALLTFRAYISWRIKQVRDESIHPILGLEEPETHLHPQAQRSLFRQILDIPGQRIVTTHSPYMVCQANILNLRHFRKNGADTIVTQLQDFTPEDIHKINQKVMNTRGELLYARAVVLFEGETEEQAIPIFAEQYWKQPPDALGVSLIEVRGSGSYTPFLRLLSSFGIDWYIFSDAEASAKDAVKAALRNIGIEDHANQRNVIYLPDNQNFESYLIFEQYQDALVEMLNEYHETDDYLQSYTRRMRGQKLRGDRRREYQQLPDGSLAPDGRDQALKEILTEGKTLYGKLIAKKITSLVEENRRFPPKISSLFEQISSHLNPP